MGIYLGGQQVVTYAGGVNSDIFATEGYVQEAVAAGTENMATTTQLDAVKAESDAKIAESNAKIDAAQAATDEALERVGALEGTHSEDITRIDADIDLTRKDWGTITIPLSGWSSAATNGWYTNQITVAGMSVNYNPYADVVYTSATTVADEDTAFGCIKEIETADGYILAKAVEKPTINVNVRLMGV